MERFIDAACVTEDNLFERAGVSEKKEGGRSSPPFSLDSFGFPSVANTEHRSSSSSSRRSNSKSSMTRSGSNKKEKKDWAQRQIAHAYEEHSSIIKKLRTELDESKWREKALLEQFSLKFKELKRTTSSTSLSAGGDRGGSSGSGIIRRNDKSSNSSDLSLHSSGSFDHEMPMDEMAHIARRERSERTMEHIEQKRKMEAFKRKADSDINKLRIKNQAQVREIEIALKLKVAEIERIKKKAQDVVQERNYYKKQNEVISLVSASPNQHGRGRGHEHEALSPAAISMGESTADGTFDTDTTGSPVHSFTNMSVPQSEDDGQGQGASLLTHRNSKVTPLQRLRAANARKGNPRTPMAEINPLGSITATQPISPITPQISDTKKSQDHDDDEDEDDDSADPKTPSSRPSRLTKLFDAMTTPNYVSFEKIAQAIEILVVEDDNEYDGESHNNEDTKSSECSSSKSLEDLKLEQEEKKLVLSIKKIFEKSTQGHIDLIDSLQHELQETNIELEMGESKASDLAQNLEKRNDLISDLENELSIVNDSAKNTDALYGMLQMVADDQKTNIVDYTAWKETMKKMEIERETLRTENADSQMEHDAAISAIQRVMADVTAEKEQVVEEMVSKISSLATENTLLKKAIDPSCDSLDRTTVSVNEEELLNLRKNAKRCATLDEQITAVRYELDNANVQNEQLRQHITELKLSEEENQSLREELMIAQETLQLRKEESNNQMNELEVSNDDMSSLIENMKEQMSQKEEIREKLLPEMIEQERTISALLKEIKSKQEKITHLEADLDTAAEVLQTAKTVHAREQRLEDELTDLRLLLEKEMAEKGMLKKEVNSQKDLEAKLKSLRMEIIEMKEEKLTLKTKVQVAETSLERSNRIMSLMQETSDTDGTACQAVLDLKEQLREEQDLHDQLNQLCSNDGHMIVQKLSRKVHTTLCLLETGVLGVSGRANKTSLSKFDFSVGTSPKEELLERSLKIQRVENDRIRKNIAEIKSAKDEESNAFETELQSLKAQFKMQIAMAGRKDEEIKTLRAGLKDSQCGYISDDDSDSEAGGDVGVASASLAIHVSKKSADEGIASMCSKLQEEKEKAEQNAKENAESLANAKLIISSIETSNKTMVSDLKLRLNESNAVIVSLLDQNKKYEQSSKQVQNELEQLRTVKKQIESELQSLPKKEMEG